MCAQLVAVKYISGWMERCHSMPVLVCNFAISSLESACNSKIVKIELFEQRTLLNIPKGVFGTTWTVMQYAKRRIW